MSVLVENNKLSWRNYYNPKTPGKKVKTPGKWLAYLPIKYAEPVWDKICDATKSGLLGYRSKISSSNYSVKNTKYPCCILYVYTYDCHDIKDALRVREELRKLGFVKPIPYMSKKILLL